MTASARAWLRFWLLARSPRLSVWPMMSTLRPASLCSAALISSRMARPDGVSVVLPLSNSMVRLASAPSRMFCSEADTRKPLLTVYVGLRLLAKSLAIFCRCASLATSPRTLTTLPSIFSWPRRICLRSAVSSFCT
ncbi:hypothetical protein D3C72_1817480 [compost metagenome]